MCRIAGRRGSVFVRVRGVDVEIPAWQLFGSNLGVCIRVRDSGRWAV